MPLAHVAAGVDHDHVAGLGREHHVAVELQVGVVVLGAVEEVLALGHALQRQRRAGGGAAGDQRDGAADVRVADAEAVELAADGGGADPRQRVGDARGRGARCRGSRRGSAC